MIDKGKQNVLGIMVDAVDYETAVSRIQEAAIERRPFAVSALAVHGVMTGVQSPEHKFRLNRFGLVVPDGQPVRWALNLLHGTALTSRVYGPELTLRVLAMAAANGLGVYFYGSTPTILDALLSSLRRRYPALIVAGAEPSKFRAISPEEQVAVANRIVASGASIAMVGLGCPRQEVFAYEMKDLLSMPLLAVGAAFPFIAGELLQAPPAMQRLGLEWLFRLKEEPMRLWRRYVLLNPYYLFLLAGQWLGMRYSSAGVEPTVDMLYG
jgi:N-acetylglucosaminyldiphosphoundecaprenol N-acetyl-beta-D-mannosaminyltransferase